MGDINQVIYLKKWVPTINGPVVEIGSKDYGSTSSFRDFYQGHEYVGVDMEPGKGVDVVCDLTESAGSLPLRHFSLGICCSVLEHVRRPWDFAIHLDSIIRPGGLLFMSVPWVWRYHAYPDDYFRFSFRGVMELFKNFAWSNIYYSTNVPEEFIALENNQGVDNSLAMIAKTQSGAQRKYLPYLMVNMLGVKK
jgi:hypothetical protein